MNYFGRPVTQWAGKEDKDADALAYAQLGMEHTEAMRRARLDAVLPYMYAGWTKTRTGQVWKAGFAKPVSACWHGLPGTVAAGSLDGPALATAQNILWVREPKTCVAAEVPVAGGKGTILFSQLDVQRRVDRSKPDYDPAAERILMNMLRGTQPKEER